MLRRIVGANAPATAVAVMVILICFSLVTVFLVAESKVSSLLVAALGAAIQAGSLWIGLFGRAHEDVKES
jgi:hypothetical protein